MLIRRQIGYLIIMQSFVFPFTSAFLKPPSLRNSPFRVIASGLASRKKVREDNDGTYPRAIAPLYKPKTANQELYAKYLGQSQYPIVLGIGPAGCGKTLFACVSAIQELRRGNIQKIVLTRPTVAVEEEELEEGGNEVMLLPLSSTLVEEGGGAEEDGEISAEADSKLLQPLSNLKEA